MSGDPSPAYSAPMGRQDFQDEVLSVVSTGKSEADRAAELTSRAQKLCPLNCAAVMDEAIREGLLIRFAGVNASPFTGKHEVVDLHFKKRF